MITGSLTSQPLYPREIDPDTLWIGRRWSVSACSGETFSAPTGFRTPFLSFHSLVTILTTPSSLQIIYIHIFNSEVALHWDSKHCKVTFEISRIQISAQTSLLFMKVQVFFPPWDKCRDTSIIRNCNVTDSFHNFSSSPVVQEVGSAAEQKY